MAVDSITGNSAAFNFQSVTTAASLDKTAEGAAVKNDLPAKLTAKSNVNDENTNNKISPNQQTPEPFIESKKKPVRSMADVVVEYNQQGEVRTKFLDSDNNVLYQIPSEMVAKMEDLMKKVDTSTNIKG